MVFTKQLRLVNLAVMSIIMNYLLKSNGKGNCLKSCFCFSCKTVEMSLRSFWHNKVDVSIVSVKHLRTEVTKKLQELTTA